MIDCLQVVRIYSVILYRYASYILLLFVKLENSNFIKEIELSVPCAS